MVYCISLIEVRIRKSIKKALKNYKKGEEYRLDCTLKIFNIMEIKPLIKKNNNEI